MSEKYMYAVFPSYQIIISWYLFHRVKIFFLYFKKKIIKEKLNRIKFFSTFFKLYCSHVYLIENFMK